MTTTNSINLTGYSTAKLSFWTKYDIEKKWDCGVVLISTNNGSTWTAIGGPLSVPASGSGKQTPAGIPVYDGTLGTWTQEDIDLTAYANKQIKIRFELRSDGSQNKDGWYVDDIDVVIYALPNPSITWLNTITVSDAGNAHQDVQFGTGPAATDGIDPNIGEISLSAIPSAGTFDTRFELPVTPVDYSLM